MTGGPRTSDPYYDRHITLSDRMTQVLPSDAGKTAEELLIEREEPPTPRRTAHPLRRILKKLSPRDRETLLATHGMGLSAPAIAKLAGVSKQAVHKRQAAAQRRVEWIAGPGRLFTNADIWRDFRWRLHDQDVLMLKLLWGLRNFTETATHMGKPNRLVRVRFLALLRVKLPEMRDEEPERYGKYVEGFTALRLAMTRK